MEKITLTREHFRQRNLSTIRMVHFLRMIYSFFLLLVGNNSNNIVLLGLLLLVQSFIPTNDRINALTSDGHFAATQTTENEAY